MLSRVLSSSLANLKQFRMVPKYSFASKNTKDDITEQEDERTARADEQKGIKEDRNTLGWIVYRCLVWGTLGVCSYHFYYLYCGPKPKITKSISEQGFRETKTQYTWRTVPGFLYVCQGIKFYIDRLLNNATEPPVKKLLPDPFHPLLHPKTLVLNLSGTMISSEYVVGKGRILTIRPGVEKLLERLSQKYEIVIWSDDDYHFITDAMTRIKNGNRLAGAFGRECFSWSYQGGLQRNLKFLNRDPRHVIVIDKDDSAMRGFTENLITVSEFNGDTNDKQFEKLILLLQRMQPQTVKDVRVVIQKLGPKPLQRFSQIVNKNQQKQKKGETSLWSRFVKK